MSKKANEALYLGKPKILEKRCLGPSFLGKGRKR